MASAASPDQAPPPAPAAVGPRLYGVIDVLRSDRIAGWAIDRADSAATVEVEIRREGRVVATVRADRMRRDLERGGVGTGRYGFACDLSPPLDPGFEFTVAAVARRADGATCELRRAGPAETSENAERRLVERIFQLVSQPPDASPIPAAEIERLVEVAQRLEVAQARIDAALSALDAPQPPSQAGLRALLGVALAVALLSLGLGIVSMLPP
jgi:hypothetical protein